MESNSAIFENLMIITDLDGTFFNSRGIPAPENIGPIKEFISKGGLFTIATGRMHNSIPDMIPEAEEIINAPVISCNGVALYDIHTKKPICEYSIDGKTAIKVLDDLHSKFEFKHIIYASDDYIQFDNNTPAEDIPSNVWRKIILRANPEVCEDMQSYIAINYSNLFYYNMSCPIFVELIPLGTNKGIMIENMRKYYKSKGRDIKIFAIGDYDNDIDMLKAADVAACPENAIDKVKEICDYVLCSNNEGCVAELIKIATNSAI